MRLLIADLLRRKRWRAVALCVFLLVMFGATAAMGDFTRAFGASMSVAFAAGTLTLQHVPRSMWYLPIAKRDIWRARWLVATVGVTLLTTAVKLAALLVPQVRASCGLAVIALSSLCDFAYVGVGCALVILATRPQPTGGPWRGASALFKGVAEIGLTSGFLLAAYGSFMLSQVLPTRWSELTARSGGVLVAALCVAVATYFHSPVPVTPANRIAPQARAKAGARRFVPGGLSGLPRLLIHEFAWALTVGGGLVAGSAIIVVVAATVMNWPEGVGGLLRSELLRLDGGPAPAPGPGLEAFILLIGFGVFATSLGSRFPGMLRHLRVLPLGVARLNALLLAWPAVIWLTAWTGLLALHYVVFGQGVASYHGSALLGLIGVSAIVQALVLRLSIVLRALVLASLAFFVPLLPFVDVPAPAPAGAIGVAGLMAAGLMNRRSLARTSTYTPIGAMIGVSATAR